MSHATDQDQASSRQTNVQVVTEMMEFSRFGALAQMFIMDALRVQARAVADAPPESFEGDDWKNSFVNGKAWQAVAREITDKLDKHLGK